MNKEPKAVTHETFLRALAFFTMAHRHHKKCAEYEKELAELLKIDDGTGYCGILSDAIYYDEGNFQRAFKNAGFTVRSCKTKKHRKLQKN